MTESSRPRVDWIAASAGAQIALGLLSLAGSLLGLPRLAQPFPGQAGLGPVDACGFVVAGVCVLAASQPRGRVPLLLGILALPTLAAAGLALQAAGVAGASRLPLALGFALAALALALLLREGGGRSLLAVHGLALLLTFSGLLGIVGAVAGFGPVAARGWDPEVPGGVGQLLLAIGLLALLSRRSLGDGSGGDGAADRIGFVAGAIIVAVGVSGLLGGFAILFPQTVAGLEQALTASLRERDARLGDVIAEALRDCQSFADLPLRVQIVRALDANPHDPQLVRLRGVVRGYADAGFSGLVFRDGAGRVVARAGGFVASPALVVPLSGPVQASLLWDHGFVVHAVVPMRDAEGVAGSLEAERRLPRDPALVDTGGFGDSLDYAVCAPGAAGGVDCFPMRSGGGRILHVRAVTGGAALPVAYALRGGSGIIRARDYRGVPIIGAYQPLGGYRIGTVLKIDAAQFYGPITRSLRPLVYVLPLIGLAAILLLRLQAMPLIRRLAAEVQRRRRVETELEHSRAEMAEITANLGEGVYVLDLQGRVTFVNPEAERLLGWNAAELIGSDAHATFHARAPGGSVLPVDDCAVHETMRSGAPKRSAREWLTRRDGSLIPVSMVSTPILRDGQVRGAVTAFSDIGEALRAEAAQQRLTRALRLVSDCNGALVRMRDEQALLEAICSLVVDPGGYLMAWIGYADRAAEHRIRPAASAGDRDGYLQRIRVSWADDAYGRGPTGTALREGSTQVNQNCLTNPRMAPWRDAALQRGYQSSIALPLHGVDGVLTVYAVEPDAFNPDEVELLEQLAGDLAYGIVALRTEAERARAVAGHREVEERYRIVLDNAADAVLVSDRRGRLVYVNQQAAELLGWSVTELQSLGVEDVVASDAGIDRSAVFAQIRAAGRLRVESAVRRRDGRLVPVELNTVRLPDGNYYAACRDISERKRYESQMEHMATHDPLTALANRTLLSDRMEQSIIHARRAGLHVAAMLLDLDRFKVVNDSLTHGTGDALLQEVARRLVAAVRAGDTVARLGGDEFMIVMADVVAEDDVVGLARKVLAEIARPVRAAGHELVVTASVGIALFPRDGDSPGTLMRNADMAMYRAKEGGRNAFEFYAEDMNQRMTQRLELESGLRRAIEQRELELHYQPKVDLADGRVVGAEALVRWRHPTRGLVPPSSFIPLAEETGLIQAIGEQLIDDACAQLRAWADAGLGGITVAVNVSARQLQQSTLPGVVAAALRRHAVPASWLELELTESALMISAERALQLLGELKGVGVRLALDDFGTGYSSLNYLKRFPIDSLKIDQSFVRDISTDPDDATIARLVIALGHDLGQKVVAEGVETEEQLRFLRRHRCDQMQGYLFSRPLPPDAFADILRSGRRLALPDAEAPPDDAVAD